LSNLFQEGLIPPVPGLLRDTLREYRERRGYSRPDLSTLTVRIGYEGVTVDQIRELETSVGRVPDADTIEMLADALSVKPEQLAFYEWPIAKARRDHREATGQRLERRGPKRPALPGNDSASTPAQRRRKDRGD
jgi:transcriptional regulator with XRE-family HTH domain